MDMLIRIDHAKPFDRALKVKPLTPAGQKCLPGLGLRRSDLPKLLTAATPSLLAFSVQHKSLIQP